MVLLHIIFCAGIFAIPIVFARLANYTLPFVIITLANIIPAIKFRIRLMVVLLVVLSQSHYYYTMRYAWTPYVSVFNKQIINAREMLWWQNFGK